MAGFFQTRLSGGKQSGTWSGHQILWLGADRLFDWDPSVGQFKVWTIDFDAASGPRLSGRPRGGSLPSNLGDRVVWLGRNRLLFVRSNGMAREILRYLPFGRQRFAVERRFSAFGRRQTMIGRDPIYLGRGRILARHPTSNGVRVLKVTGTAIDDLEAPHADGAPLAAVPPGDLTLTWMGADRVLGWRGSGQPLALYRHGPLGRALTGQIVPQTWTLPTGPLSRGRRGRGLRGVTPKPAPVAASLVTYVGRDTALILWPGTGAYEYWQLGFNGSIHPTIEDYLELHPEIADAMTWELHSESLPFQDWDLHPWTQGFHATLSRFYDEASWGGPISLAFAQEDDPDLGPGRKRVGPARAPGGPPSVFLKFSLRDMAEIWLAHLAHYLWVEIDRQVPWHLHDLASDMLAVNLPGKQMFEQVEGVPADEEPLYATNRLEAGGGLATDPSPVFAFARDKGLLQATRSATVDAICRWVQGNLMHFQNIGQRDYAESWDWNFPIPPLLTMLERRLDPLKPPGQTPAYQAWTGCHGANCVMTFLARVLNVPARGTRSRLPDLHGAIDFPEEQWFCPHADDFYTVGEFLDPAVTPTHIFGSKSNHRTDLSYWTSEASDPEERGRFYERWIYVRTKDIPAFWLIEAYWTDMIHGTNTSPNTGVLADALEKHGLTDSEVASEVGNLTPSLQAIIDTFMQTPAMVGKTLQEGLDTYRLPIDAWNAARGTT